MWEREERGKIIQKRGEYIHTYIHMYVRTYSLTPSTNVVFSSSACRKAWPGVPGAGKNTWYKLFAHAQLTQKSGKIGYSMFSDDTIRHAFLHALEKNVTFVPVVWL